MLASGYSLAAISLFLAAAIRRFSDLRSLYELLREKKSDSS